MAKTKTAGTAWLTTEELSDRLKVPVTTIYKWRVEGYGPQGVRMGRHTRFALADVEAFEAWLREREAARRGAR